MRQWFRSNTYNSLVNIFILSTAIISLASFSVQSYASGSSYLPLQVAPEIESKIERLFVQVNIPIIKRPIAVKAVHRALDKLGDSDPMLSRQIKQYLERYNKKMGLTHVQVSAGKASDIAQARPNKRGQLTTSNYAADFSGYWAASDWLFVNIGGSYYDSDNAQKNTFPDNSYISLGWEALQLDVGYRPHWLGPFQDSDMLISTQAPTLPSITLSNAVPIGFLGFSYEAFVAKMSKSDKILSNDNSRRVTGNPRLFGLHFSINPLDGFAIGVNRLMQFGGGDRDDSPASVFEALISPRDADNRDPDDPTDFGNQASSITTRYTFADNFPVSVYMEYAGEDTSGASGLALGNTSTMLGFHLPKLSKSLDFTYEFASWQNAWYVNGVFADGLRNYDQIIGHWGASQRIFSDPVGAKSQMVKLIWSINEGKSLDIRLRSLENENYSNTEYKRATELSVQYSHAWRNYITGLNFSYGESVFGDNHSLLEGFIRW